MSKDNIIYCGKCGEERNLGTWWLNPDEVKRVGGYKMSIDIPANRWCRDCINEYYIIPKNHLPVVCEKCGHTIKEMDVCGYKQSLGKTCDDRHCKRCYGNEAWVFDRT